jgi:cytochrome c biogenesis protein CcmG/thiol:disulfide interchange protein DsbE
VGLLGAGAAAVWAGPKIIRRLDRLDPGNFTLPPLAHGERGLASTDLAGSILTFWASWCPECIGEHDRLMALARESVPLIGVASMDEGERARNFLAKHGNPYRRTALDARGALLRGFGFRGVPGFIVVNADGAPRLRHEGPLDDRVVGTRILPALRAA